MSTYSAAASTLEGRRGLATARLRYRMLGELEKALRAAGITKVELSQRLGLRKSAVSQVFRGDGNLRVNTIAEYLDAMDCELQVRVVRAGTSRLQAVGEPDKPRLVFCASEGKDLSTLREGGRVRPDAVRPAAPHWADQKAANA